jgi:hypothetical protein
LGYSLSAKLEREEQHGWIRKERIRNIEINRYFSFQILLNIHLLFVLVTLSKTTGNRPLSSHWKKWKMWSKLMKYKRRGAESKK